MEAAIVAFTRMEGLFMSEFTQDEIIELWVQSNQDIYVFAKMVAEAAVAKERSEFAVYAVEIMRRTLKTRGEA